MFYEFETTYISVSVKEEDKEKTPDVENSDQIIYLKEDGAISYDREDIQLITVLVVDFFEWIESATYKGALLNSQKRIRE